MSSLQKAPEIALKILWSYWDWKLFKVPCISLTVYPYNGSFIFLKKVKNKIQKQTNKKAILYPRVGTKDPIEAPNYTHRKQFHFFHWNGGCVAWPFLREQSSCLIEVLRWPTPCGNKNASSMTIMPSIPSLTGGTAGQINGNDQNGIPTTPGKPIEIILFHFGSNLSGSVPLMN